MASPSASLPVRAAALAQALRAFQIRWALKPLGAGDDARARMDAAALERYFSNYASQVQALRDEFLTRGFTDETLDRLCDDLMWRDQVLDVASSLDALAKRIRR